MLPEPFLAEMKNYLKREYDPFVEAMARPAYRGVRLQRLTALQADKSVQSPEKTYPLAVASRKRSVPPCIADELGAPIPWMEDAFYIPIDSRLGKNVYHETGAYYIQEPSAMAVASALNVQPGEYVLDLCAAPGGKTTAIGRALSGSGTLVANEIHPSRVLILAQNLERTGIPAVVTNEDPTRLSEPWEGIFDAVLVDAPCSGEGMFRKDRGAVTAWNPESPALCGIRQRDILRHAFRMVKPGGRLVYSTCTFNPVENEQIVAWIMENFPVEVVPLPNWPGWDEGNPAWANDTEECRHARRLWPHHGAGEGHFVALFRVCDGVTWSNQSEPRKQDKLTQSLGVAGWLDEMFHDVPDHWKNASVHKNHVVSDESGGIPLHDLKVLRRGVSLATIEKKRLEPHHHVAMTVSQSSPRLTHELSTSEAKTYISGQTVVQSDLRGWTWLHVGGLPIGFGKCIPGRINNQYPRGLRRNDLID